MDKQQCRGTEELPVRARMCALAVVTVVLGVFGCLTMIIVIAGLVGVFGMIASIVAVGTGLIALWQIRRAVGVLRGRGPAMAGMVMGCIGALNIISCPSP